MKKIIAILIAVFLLGNFTASFVVAVSQIHAQVSVCTDTGLTGAAADENNRYCPATTSYTQFSAGSTPVTVNDSLAPSTYQAAISLAKAKNIIVGTPLIVSESVDWHGCPKTVVAFTSGYWAEHYNQGDACNGGNLTVRYYSPLVTSNGVPIQVWP